MRKRSKYLITAIISCLLIGAIAYNYKSADTKENISKVNSIRIATATMDSKPKKLSIK